LNLKLFTLPSNFNFLRDYQVIPKKEKISRMYITAITPSLGVIADGSISS